MALSALHTMHRNLYVVDGLGHAAAGVAGTRSDPIQSRGGSNLMSIRQEEIVLLLPRDAGYGLMTATQRTIVLKKPSLGGITRHRSEAVSSEIARRYRSPSNSVPAPKRRKGRTSCEG